MLGLSVPGDREEQVIHHKTPVLSPLVIYRKRYDQSVQFDISTEVLPKYFGLK